jgi:hypothetical protein
MKKLVFAFALLIGTFSNCQEIVANNQYSNLISLSLDKDQIEKKLMPIDISFEDSTLDMINVSICFDLNNSVLLINSSFHGNIANVTKNKNYIDLEIAYDFPFYKYCRIFKKSKKIIFYNIIDNKLEGTYITRYDVKKFY